MSIENIKKALEKVYIGEWQDRSTPVTGDLIERLRANKPHMSYGLDRVEQQWPASDLEIEAAAAIERLEAAVLEQAKGMLRQLEACEAYRVRAETAEKAYDLWKPATVPHQVTSAQREKKMADRHLLQWDIKEDRNAYRDGPLAKDKSVYSFIGWEGCHRGSLLLTKAEADFIRERLTNANPS